MLTRDLEVKGIRVERQKQVPFDFEGQHFKDGLRLDMLVESQIIVEIKSVEVLAAVHTKQVLTYLRLLDLRVGLLINFGGATLKEGLRRFVNGYVPPNLRSQLPPSLGAKPTASPRDQTRGERSGF